MYGRSIETMNVYIDEFSSMQPELFQRKLVWTRTGSQSDRWLNQMHTINSAKPWRVVFEGVIGSTGVGDMSIDDLSLVDGKCPPRKQCDFEDSFCDYTQYQGKAWTRGQPTTNSIDHTTLTNQGSFAFVKFDSGSTETNGMYRFLALSTLFMI